MATKKKTTESPKKETVSKPVPMWYNDDKSDVKMLGSMITTEEKFKSIWGSRLKGDKLDSAWKRANAWRSKFD